MMLILTLRLLMVSLTKSWLSSAIQSCDSAKVQCASTSGCQMALQNFHLVCNSVIYGDATTCSRNCINALIAILTTAGEAGRAFYNCDCRGDEFCEERKQRVEICRSEVVAGIREVDDEKSVVSCTFAQWLCEADTSCQTALLYYVENCGKLMNGEKCTARCKNSLNILYRQNSSQKLQTCYCDGSENYNCEKLKYNMERLCFHRAGNIPYVTASDNPAKTGTGSRDHSRGRGSSHHRASGKRYRKVKRRKNRLAKKRRRMSLWKMYFGGRKKRKRRIRKRRIRQRSLRKKKRSLICILTPT